MAGTELYDALVLGSGKAGKLLAWHLAQSGKRTAVVERQWIGGSCPNIACLPSKNEIWGAKVAHLARNAALYGTVTGNVTTDMQAVRERKRAMVRREIAAHLEYFRKTGAELVMGSGRFVQPKTIEVRLNEGGTRTLRGQHVFLDVGTRTSIPSIRGLEEARPLTHIEALELGYLPAHLLVLGGGHIGLEMAQAYRRFGSRVTIIESGSQLMGREDPDVASEMQRILSDSGIQILLTAETCSVDGRSGDAVRMNVRTAAGEQSIEGSDILVATGRIPNTAEIGLELTGVELDERGYIRVNERLETTAADVWAMGECSGSPQFTHIAGDDFRIIRDNLAGGSRSTRDRLVPYCVFTDPPLAHVGITEHDAERDHLTVRVMKLPTSAISRTGATDETQGFMKALVGGDDDSILGFTMIGAEAGEVITVVQTAMMANMPYTTLREAVLTHQTMAEGLGLLFGNVPSPSA